MEDTPYLQHEITLTSGDEVFLDATAPTTGGGGSLHRFHIVFLHIQSPASGCAVAKWLKMALKCVKLSYILHILAIFYTFAKMWLTINIYGCILRISTTDRHSRQ
jgi:hypothetical protein